MSKRLDWTTITEFALAAALVVSTATFIKECLHAHALIVAAAAAWMAWDGLTRKTLR